MNSKNDTKPVEVFAGTSIQASMVRSFLANADIDSFVVDDNMGTIAPWQVSAGGAGAVKVFVAEENMERSIELIRQMEII